MSEDLRDKFENRSYAIADSRSEFGRSRILIVCPFCQCEVWAYSWSLAGSGKRCPKCGAMHTFLAGTVKRKEEA